VRLASYIAEGRWSFGAVTESGVVTMNDRLRNRYPSLRQAIAAGAIDEMREIAARAKPDRDLAGLGFLPVIPYPNKFLCVGINYRSHAAEQGHAAAEKPNIFTKFSDTLVAHEGSMMRPTASEQFDFEGELAVIIGRGGRAISETDALDHVAGYTCCCDGSVRDFIKASLITGKNFPASTPIGPWMVTADEIPDPSALTLVTRLNGAEMQRSGTDMMIHSVPQLIAYCSTFTTLSPGDVISTGTPDGIGARRKPPVWMKAGDVLEVEISGIGTLRSRVIDEP
jgi:2-keto-4-pentenoate hydratase/2-oxohepta-3-ene-1,7-dioic acid hydratase in catechol pathway